MWWFWYAQMKLEASADHSVLVAMCSAFERHQCR